MRSPAESPYGGVEENSSLKTTLFHFLICFIKKSNFSRRVATSGYELSNVKYHTIDFIWEDNGNITYLGSPIFRIKFASAEIDGQLRRPRLVLNRVSNFCCVMPYGYDSDFHSFTIRKLAFVCE